MQPLPFSPRMSINGTMLELNSTFVRTGTQPEGDLSDLIII
jgi:hypothetical protein